MDYDFTIEEMTKRLAEFPPKDLKEIIISETQKTTFYYSKTLLKENIFNYVASLPESDIRALFDKAAKKRPNILKPCCNVCAHAFPTMYEDIPGSHVSGWWIGGCELDEEHREIGSSQNTPSPAWCPVKTNYK